MNHQYNMRMNYEMAMAAIAANGVNANNAILSQSFLRLEVLASTTKTSYQWGVLVNDAPQGQPVRPTETRLNLQDAFYCTQVQILLGIQTGTDSSFPVYAWNNPAKFTTAGAALALNNFYNGYLSLTVNNRVITPAWDLLRHYTANQTQFTAAANSPQDQFNGGLDGGYPTVPNWVLIGSKNNQLTATLPASIGTLQAAVNTVLIIEMRGILAQNVTVVS
jgi:hypothetical protein